MAKNKNPRGIRHVGADAPGNSPASDASQIRLNGVGQGGEAPNGQPSGFAEQERPVARDHVRRASSRRKTKRPMSALKKTLVIAGGALVCVALFFAVKFVADITNPAGLFDTPSPSPAAVETAEPTLAAGQTPPPATPNPEETLLSQADLEFMKNRVNILVVGIDESTERENWGSFRTDTMILVSINFDTNDVDMISVPRDSFVKIYTSKGSLVTSEQNVTGMNKINSAFSSGGGSKKNGFELPDSDAKIYSAGFEYALSKQMKMGLAYLYSDKEDRSVTNSAGVNGKFSDSAAHLVTASLKYKF